MKKWPQAVQGEVQIVCQGQFLHGKGGQALEQAAQGSGGIIIPGGLRDVWLWHQFSGGLGNGGLMAGLDDLKGHFQPK